MGERAREAFFVAPHRRLACRIADRRAGADIV